MLILFFIQCVIVVGFRIAAYRSYKPFIEEHKTNLKVAVMAPVSLYLTERLKLSDRMPDAVAKIHMTMAGLHDRKTAMIRTKLFLADMLSAGLLMIMIATLLGFISGNDPLFLLYGSVIAVFLPFLMYKELAKKLHGKKRQILVELPEVLNQMTLLINAGETTQRALIRCIEAKKGGITSPLMKELAKVAHELQMNVSFSKSMEEFSKRCGIQEVSLFSTTVLLNYKRGGDELVLALKELSSALWEKRKAVARTLGEEASTKMVFPMVLIFFVVMVIVAAPALFLMGNS